VWRGTSRTVEVAEESVRIKQFGRTGLRVSEICLGTMTFGGQADEATSFAIMDRAFAAGVFFFDTADVYPAGGGAARAGATETIIGNWLRERGVREQVVLASKCRGATGTGPNDQGLSRKHIIAACDASLRRLGTDYLDLYQAHHPDPATPIDETLDALTDLVRAGKVRYIGCSNFQAWRLAEALAESERQRLARFVSVQPRYNLLFRMIEDEILPLCASQGLAVMAYNPLAGGVLTGRYRGVREAQPDTRFTLEGSGAMYQRRYWQEAMLVEVERLGEIVEERGQALTQVALAWVLAQPAITCAIVGASRPEQLADSLPAVDVALDPEILRACDDVWFNLPRERDPQFALR
jgi:aryl-alcohol dehydrogenase-like predicted oxidoreductase